MKYRKKPIVIEAALYSGGKFQGEIPAWIGPEMSKGKIYRMGPSLFIKTLEGTMEVKSGDWIIQGINGEIYPCKPDIFEKTYEQVEG